MNALSEHFARQLDANPDATYSVMITQHPYADELPASSLSANIQPIEGLKGIYKATLSGHDILKLRQDDTIQAIEPDEPDFHAL